MEQHPLSSLRPFALLFSSEQNRIILITREDNPLEVLIIFKGANLKEQKLVTSRYQTFIGGLDSICNLLNCRNCLQNKTKKRIADITQQKKDNYK